MCHLRSLQNKAGRMWVHLTPDLVVEVVSKSSVTRHLHEKYALYEQAGVKEYWLANPNDKSLIIFVLNKTGHYTPAKPLTLGDVARSSVLPGLAIDLNEVFANVVEEPEEGYYTQKSFYCTAFVLLNPDEADIKQI